MSRAGRQKGTTDPRYQYFYDMVRVVNFLWWEQTAPLVYILENTYPGKQCTPAVTKAREVVQAFLGAPILVDAADIDTTTHSVRLFWTNMPNPANLQAALPTHLPPSPSLDTILKSYHIPTKPGHSDHFRFATHNRAEWELICMPTVVSYLKSNARRPKSNGDPGTPSGLNPTVI